MFMQANIYRIVKLALGLWLGVWFSLRIGATILFARKRNLPTHL